MIKYFAGIFFHIRIKIACRNIFRHQLRSFLSVCMIASVVGSIIVFKGFTDYYIQAVKFIASENQYGHMQIANKKYWSPGKENKKDRMFRLDDLKVLKLSHPEISQISGRLSFFALLSNADISITGKIIGIDPDNEPSFKNSMNIKYGKIFQHNNSNEIIAGQLLAKQMNVKVGDTITILSNTVDGVVNAIDAQVSGLFSAGIDEIDSQVIYMPSLMAQKILNTEKVDIAVVKFKDVQMAEKNLNKINDDLLNNNMTDLKARSWKDLSVLYRQLVLFYGTQNLVIETILLALMFLGILNTISITIIERTGEIGTLRSFGESRSNIVAQFMLESLIVTFFSGVIGTIGAWLFIKIIDVAKIMIDTPGASIPYAVHINFLFSAITYACVLTLLTSIIATYFPAKRAADMNIVDALRKNI